MSTRVRRGLAGFAVLSVAALMPLAAEATVLRPLEVLSTADAYFVSGGVGEQERSELRKGAREYNLQVTFARADGAFLSYVDVKIDGAALKESIELTTAGPLLLAKLPPGNYTLAAEVDGWNPVRRQLIVGKSRSDLFLKFDRATEARASR